MTEYKPRTTPIDRQRSFSLCKARLDEFFECIVLARIFTDLAHAESCLKERDAALAECYKASGAEPSGEDWRDAPYAVREVWRLRKESEEELELLDKRVKERDAEIERLREEIKQLNKINGE